MVIDVNQTVTTPRQGIRWWSIKPGIVVFNQGATNNPISFASSPPATAISGKTASSPDAPEGLNVSSTSSSWRKPEWCRAANALHPLLLLQHFFSRHLTFWLPRTSTK